MKNKIYETLKNLNIQFDEIEHEATTSCEHSKSLRAEKWFEWAWSKNILFHCKWKFYMVITLWDKQIKARKFKKEFWSKDIRFANEDEIKQVINGTIGCIPSFGFKNEEIPVYVDIEIFEHKYFMFNPDNPEKTIRLETSDLKKVYKSMKNPVKFFKDGENGFKVFEEIDL